MDVRQCRPLLAAALLLTHPHAGALPVLLEVYYDAPGADAASVFTELAGTGGFSLDGYSLVGINGSNGAVYRTIALTGARIPGDGIFVLATASASGTTLDARDFIANVDWQNGPDAVQLLAPGGSVVDALQYGSLAAFAAGEGSSAADVTPGRSLSRDARATDSNDNAADFRIATPGPGSGFAAPVLLRRISVPEPGTLTLVAMALLLAASLKRRRRTAIEVSPVRHADGRQASHDDDAARHSRLLPRGWTAACTRGVGAGTLPT